MIIKRKLGPKGQLLIPKDVRMLLGVEPGDEIIIEISENSVHLKSSPDTRNFLEKFEAIPKKLSKRINFDKILDEQYDALLPN